MSQKTKRSTVIIPSVEKNKDTRYVIILFTRPGGEFQPALAGICNGKVKPGLF